LNDNRIILLNGTSLFILSNFFFKSLKNSNFVDLVQLDLENKLLEDLEKVFRKNFYVGVVIVKINEKFQNTTFRYFSITLSLFF